MGIVNKKKYTISVKINGNKSVKKVLRQMDNFIQRIERTSVWSIYHNIEYGYTAADFQNHKVTAQISNFDKNPKMKYRVRVKINAYKSIETILYQIDILIRRIKRTKDIEALSHDILYGYDIDDFENHKITAQITFY